jgi:hypothetical protein
MELEINDLLADLPANQRGLIRLNKSLAAIADIETRRGEYSWPLTLPATRNNARIFGLKLHPQTLDKFSGEYRFRLRSGGQQWQGIFKLTALTPNGYTGVLITDTLGWATGLGDKPLTALETLRAIPYDGSQLEAVLGRNCDETDLQFPLVAYGNFFAPPTLDEDGQEVPASASQEIEHPLSVDDYAPSVYYLNVLRAVLREAGYYAAGAILNDPEIRRWVITSAGSEGDFWPWGGLIPAYRASAGSQEQFMYYDLGPDGGYSNTAAGFDAVNDVAYFMPATPVVPLVNGQPKPGGTRAMNPTKPEFIAPRDGSYSFRYFVTVSAAFQNVDAFPFSAYFAGFAPVALALMVFRQGEGYEGADDGLCTGLTGNFTGPRPHMLSILRLDNPGSFTLQTGSFTANVPNVYLEAGDTVRLLIFTRRRRASAGGIPTYTRREFRFTTSVVEFACTAHDGPLLLNPAAVLPPIKQKDLLKDFLLRTNTVPVTDIERRTVHFLSRAEHAAAQGEPLDLDPLADPKTAEYSPVLGGVGRIVFQPAATDDAAAPAGTDAVTVALPGRPTTDGEKTISSPFAATGTVVFRVRPANSPRPGPVLGYEYGLGRRRRRRQPLLPRVSQPVPARASMQSTLHPKTQRL